jgi:fructose-specific phosphotransferase system IIA component
MALIDLINEDVVKVPLTSTSKPEIIRELIQILADKGTIEDAEKVYNAIMDREAQGSTGLEQGIAVPHAKTDAVTDLTIAIGISPKGIDFESLDNEPSKIFFLMLAPPDKSGPHIEALSEIAKLTKSKSFLKMLTNAQSAEEVVDLFRE